MQTALWIIFGILIIVAILGCFVSKFPGPQLAFVAILLAKVAIEGPKDLIPWWAVAVVALLVVASIMLSKYVPQLAKKIVPYSKKGDRGALFGSLIALFLLLCCANGVSSVVLVILMIALPLVLAYSGALIGEYLDKKDWNPALKSAGSATMVYACTTLVKLIIVCYSIQLVLTAN